MKDQSPQIILPSGVHVEDYCMAALGSDCSEFLGKLGGEGMWEGLSLDFLESARRKAVGCSVL